MAIKKKCREINQAKNKFLEWLKERNAKDIDVYEGQKYGDDGFDYYRNVSAFVDNKLYCVCFTMWRGDVKIDYSDEGNSYNNMSIEEFLDLL
jgi:hypothetical protein